MEYTVLENGLSLPKVVFGTYRIHDQDDVQHVIADAYACGYRAFDSAAYYKNEAELREAFDALGIREQVLVTSKVWNDAHGHEAVLEEFEKSEALLGKVDIFMLHWPADEFLSRWKALEDIYAAGRVKAIGVSNFKKHHLETLLAHAKIKPMINQIEAHAYFMDYETIAYCQAHGICVQAWRPLMRTGDMLQNQEIAQIGQKYGKTTAQVCLRFLLQSGLSVLPKTVKPERMKENIELFDFALSAQDMEFMRGLNTGRRTADDPDDYPWNR